MGGEAFWEKLRAVDPERAARLPAADKRRLVRAMEVFAVTGTTITEHDRRDKERPPRYDSRRLALDFKDRQRLYGRIDARVDDMVARGLFDEVRTLLDAGLSPEGTAMQAIGYKEAATALRGLTTREAATELIKRESRRYAKRQLTWLRRDAGLHWLRWDTEPDPAAALRFLERSLTFS